MDAVGRWGSKKCLRPALAYCLTVSIWACASPVKHPACQPRGLGHLNLSSTCWHREGDKGSPPEKHPAPLQPGQVSLGGLWAAAALPSGVGRAGSAGAASLPG